MVLALPADAVERFFAVKRLYAAALDFIVAVIERGAKLREFHQIASHGVLDKVVRCTPSGRGKLLETRFSFGFEMHYHRTEFRGTQLDCQSDSGAAMEAGGPDIRNRRGSGAPSRYSASGADAFI